MPAAYQFKCNTCSKTGLYDHELTAAAAGWGIAHVVFKGKHAYMVFCPSHVPLWLPKAVADVTPKSPKG